MNGLIIVLLVNVFSLLLAKLDCLVNGPGSGFQSI